MLTLLKASFLTIYILTLLNTYQNFFEKAGRSLVSADI